MVFSLNASNNWIMGKIVDSRSSECCALVPHEPCILRFVLSIGYFEIVLEKKTNREKNFFSSFF